MELLDRDAGHRRRRDDVANESFVFEDAGQSVLRPHGGQEPVPVRLNQQKLDLVADQCLDSGLGEGRLYPCQRSAAAGRDRRAVLLEK